MREQPERGRDRSQGAGGSQGTGGSAEYREGSPQYREELGDIGRSAEAPPSLPSGPEPFWKRMGFSSHAQFLRSLEETQSLYDPYAEQRKAMVRARGAMPEDWAPSQRPDPPGSADEVMRSRQVGVKLNATEYEALERVAEVYGTTRAGMARMLVNRGVQSIIAALEVERGES